MRNGHTEQTLLEPRAFSQRAFSGSGLGGRPAVLGLLLFSIWIYPGHKAIQGFIRLVGMRVVSKFSRKNRAGVHPRISCAFVVDLLCSLDLLEHRYQARGHGNISGRIDRLAFGDADRLTHFQGVRFEVHIRPPQSHHFTTAQTDRQGCSARPRSAPDRGALELDVLRGGARAGGVAGDDGQRGAGGEECGA